MSRGSAERMEHRRRPMHHHLAAPSQPHLGQHRVLRGSQQLGDDPVCASSGGDALGHHEEHCVGAAGGRGGAGRAGGWSEVLCVRLPAS